jgi:hypothetical protein
MAHAGGTLTVCADAKACITLRIRPPKKDAMDEVFGTSPAWAPPGSGRVIVAHTTEGPYPKDGPAPATLWLDVYDLKQKRKVSATVVRREVYAIDMIPIGERALLLTCSRKEDRRCSMFLVDPRGPSAKALPIELHPDLPNRSRFSPYSLRSTTTLARDGGRPPGQGVGDGDRLHWKGF